MTDHYAWTIETARRMRAGDPVDSVAVAEELEEMGRAEKHELESRIVQILEHLLKLRLITGVVLEQNARSWRVSVERQRIEIAALLRTSPSLRSLLTQDLLDRSYRAAGRLLVAGFDAKPPRSCPFAWSDVLGEEEGLDDAL